MFKQPLITLGLLWVALGAGLARAERVPEAKAQISPPTPQWLAAVEAAAPARPTVPAARRKLLVFSRFTGFDHKVIPYVDQVFKTLGAKSGAFDAAVSVDIEALTPENLKPVDVLVLNNNCSQSPRRNLFLDVLETDARYQGLTAAQREAKAAAFEQSLLDFVAGGKGLVLIHGAPTILNNSPRFTEMVGGAFYYHPPNQEVTLRTVDPHHPLVAAFQGREPFIHRDEPYCFNGPYARFNFHPLLSVDTQGLKDPKGEAAKMVRYVAWIKPYGKGRVFFCSPSHFPESYTSPTLLRFLLDGVQYAGGDLKCDDAPLRSAPPQPAARNQSAARNRHGEPVISDLHELQIGDAAPDFSLRGIDGKTHTLADYGTAQILLVAFISNHCPDSHAAQGRLLKLAAELKDRGLAVVAVNPNNPEGLSINELGYSKYSDGFDDMQKYAADTGLTVPYLYDGRQQVMARTYGCLATPHVFIFDARRKLRYKGYFDDSRFADESTVKSRDARNAVEALLAGRPVPVEVTRPHGCSTKWVEKKSLVAATVEKWNKTPVDVAPIDAAGVAALRQNGTKKVRLFNVWATWCVPCLAEFPELVKTARQFGMRDFELITISLDDPKDTAKVKGFLEKQGAGLLDRLKPSLQAEGRTTNSYVYTGTGGKELIKALDPSWPGPAPHTVLVGPEGNIIWSHNGPLDGDQLRAKVLEFMGPYYRP